MKAILKFVVSGAVFLWCASPSFAQREVISGISRHHSETEKQLEEMRHLSFSEFNLEGEFTNTINAWFDPDGSLRKVADDGASTHGDLLEEFYFRDGELIFVYTLHKNTPMVVRAKTTVEEERIYFNKAKSVRYLTKKGVFAEGVKHNMAPFRNKESTLPNGGKREFAAFASHALGIAKRLEQMADPDKAKTPAPSGKSTYPNGEDYRLIRGSVSPDARFAVGWAPDVKGFRWEDYTDDGKSFMGDPDKCSNYLVDLASQRRLAKLPGKHFGDKQLYNHTHCEFDWSPDSRELVQSIHMKWHTESCALVRLDKSGGIESRVDLLAAATNSAIAHFEKHDDPVYRRYGDGMIFEVRDLMVFEGSGGTFKLGGVDVAAVKRGADASGQVRVSFDEKGKISSVDTMADDS